MPVKTQKMLFTVILPEAMGGLGLISENAAGIPPLEPTQVVQGFPPGCLVWKKITFMLLSKPVQWQPLSVAQ